MPPIMDNAIAAVTNSHSGRKPDLSVAVLPPAAKGLPPWLLNVPPVVAIFDPSVLWGTDFDILEKKQLFEYNKIVAGAGM